MKLKKTANKTKLVSIKWKIVVINFCSRELFACFGFFPCTQNVLHGLLIADSCENEGKWWESEGDSGSSFGEMKKVLFSNPFLINTLSKHFTSLPESKSEKNCATLNQKENSPRRKWEQHNPGEKNCKNSIKSKLLEMLKGENIGESEAFCKSPSKKVDLELEF